MSNSELGDSPDHANVQAGATGNLDLLGNVSVLLGAGASVEAGIPSSFEMTEKILDLLPHISHDKTTWALNFICGAMTAHATAQGEPFRGGLDVEKVFAAVQLLSERREHEATPFVSTWHPAVEQIDLPPKPPFLRMHLQQAFEKEVASILRRARVNNNQISYTGGGGNIFGSGLAASIESLVDSRAGAGTGSVYSRLRENMIQALNQLLRIPGPYAVDYLSPLLKLLEHQDVISIGTLNYDRSIEILCASKSVTCETGIEQWSRDRTFGNLEEGVRLFKLHGSIDWRNDSIRDAPGKMPSTTVSVVSDSMPNGSPAIVFGQREKLRATGPFLDLLFSWEASLANIDSVIVVGYSFRDGHINEVLRRWVNGNLSRRLFVVDPSWYESGQDFRSDLRENLAPKYPHPNSTTVPPRLRIVTEKAGLGLNQLLQ